MLDVKDEQIAVPCTIMRGGTSKGIFFRETDIPAPGPLRDAFLKRMMGTPHPMQIDGLGGSNLLTSKIAIIGAPSIPEADVDYTFVQVEINRSVVDYKGNCGNISAAVAPYAIEEGLVKAEGEVATIRIHNTNTGKILLSRVALRNGKARVAGDTAIPGVNGTGSAVFLDYLETTGAKSGSILPTGNRVDTIVLEDGRLLEGTICDVANPAIFVRAGDIGMSGSELPAAIDGDAKLIALLREIRGKAGVLMGYTRDWRKIDDDSPLLPFVMIVAAPTDYVGSDGKTIVAADVDIRVRMIFMNHCHEAMAGTGSMCIAAATQIPDTIANEALGSRDAGSETLRIGHPSGSMHITVRTRPSNGLEGVRFEALGFVRTARRIMDGAVYVPIADLPGIDQI